MKKVSGVTLTVVTESPIALSNDQGFGNYTPIKKYFYKDGIHATTSVATFTYELRKCLFENFGWKLNDLTIKKGNSFFNNVEELSDKNLEADVFGFLLPDQRVSKTSPLRVIPFISVNTFKNDTQLITNRGFFNLSLERNRFDGNGVELEVKDVPTTQALANEEVFGDYYSYTLTIELDRLGVCEVQKNKDGQYAYLAPEERKFMKPELRVQAVQDILNALTILTRDIKHQRVFLKPLAVFGGAFEQVVPYFWDAIQFENTNEEQAPKLSLEAVTAVEQAYHLDHVIKSVDSRLLSKKESHADSVQQNPVQAIQNLANRLVIKDNEWYLTD